MPTKCTLTIQCHRLCFIMEMTFEANNGIQSLEVVFYRALTQTSFEDLSSKFPLGLLLTAEKPRFFAVVFV